MTSPASTRSTPRNRSALLDNGPLTPATAAGPAPLEDAGYDSSRPREPHFPPSPRPRVWFITAGDAPICVAVTRQLLEHGDFVVAGLPEQTIAGRESNRFELEALAQEYPDTTDEVSDQRQEGKSALSTFISLPAEDWMEFDMPGQHYSYENSESVPSPQPLQSPSIDSNNHLRGSGKLTLVTYSILSVSSIQMAYAKATSLYGRIDVLLVANNETVVGCVEELGNSSRAQSLLKDQFSTNFFGPVNSIKSVLSVMRKNPRHNTVASEGGTDALEGGIKGLEAVSRSLDERRKKPGKIGDSSLYSGPGGHVMLLTGVSGHLGTPGLAAYCASQWAIEGYCDSLAYEVAPFNIRISILQSNIEVGVLTNPIKAVPAIDDAYGVGSVRRDTADENTRATSKTSSNHAPLARGWLGGLVRRLEKCSGVSTTGSSDIVSGHEAADTGCPPLPQSFRDSLIAETVYAILEIGGHENPPSRHIVGHEGIASVKEKLKTVSEELEDFVAVSASVDF